MIYVIDHNDSFTHNVVHQFSLFDEGECDNYNEINKTKLQKAKVLVFSPGPGNPKDYPTTSKILPVGIDCSSVSQIDLELMTTTWSSLF